MNSVQELIKLIELETNPVEVVKDKPLDISGMLEIKGLIKSVDALSKHQAALVKLAGRKKLDNTPAINGISDAISSQLPIDIKPIVAAIEKLSKQLTNQPMIKPVKELNVVRLYSGLIDKIKLIR